MLGAQSLSSDDMAREYEAEDSEQRNQDARAGREKALAGSGVTLGGHRVFTYNIMHSARCNWDRGDDELMQCLPNKEEWEQFQT